MSEKIHNFDTTLRDGEQAPGSSLETEEKIEIAKQLSKHNVDVIEAGFPVSSKAQYKAVESIADLVNGPTIAALARCIENDIEKTPKDNDLSEKETNLVNVSEDLSRENDIKNILKKGIRFTPNKWHPLRPYPTC